MVAADGSVCLYVAMEVGGGYVGITDLLAFIDCSWPRGCSSGTDALVDLWCGQGQNDPVLSVLKSNDLEVVGQGHT